MSNAKKFNARTPVSEKKNSFNSVDDTENMEYIEDMEDTDMEDVENTDEMDFTDYMDEDTDEMEDVDEIKDMENPKYVENIVDSTGAKNVVVGTSRMPMKISSMVGNSKSKEPSPVWKYIEKIIVENKVVEKKCK
ncbi:9476_t:CDS:1, partial [Dentiscutata heterogama]